MVQSVDHAADKALQYWEWDADRCVLTAVSCDEVLFGFWHRVEHEGPFASATVYSVMKCKAVKKI